MKKKNILIFGASGLIGKQLFLSPKLNLDYNVIGFDIKSKNDKRIIKLNTLDSKNIKKKINQIHKNFGIIHGFINVTFPPVLQKKDPPKINSKKFSKELSIHVESFLNTTQAACEYFSKNKIKGRIINFASIYGDFIPRFEIYKNTNMSLPIQYSICKSSIIMLTRYFSKFFLKKKININSISPGGVFDNQNRIFIKNYNKYTASGMLDKNDITGVVEFLLSSNSKKIFGQNLIIDDGFTL